MKGRRVEYRGVVPCSGCGKDAPLKTARQRIECWAQTGSGEGTLTHPRLIKRSGVWLCEQCVKAAEYGTRPVTTQEGLL